MNACWLSILLAAMVSAQTDERLETWKRLAVIPLQATLYHVQGIDVEGEALWVSSVHARAEKGFLTKFELPSGRVLAQVEVQQGRRLHPGGIMLDGEWLWVPVAEYDRNRPTNIERRDKHTLKLISRFEVPDHIGCVAAGANLIGGNWDSRVFYRWSRDGRELGRIPNPNRTAYQDLKMVDGTLVGSGGVSRDLGAIEWLRPETWRPLRRLIAGKTDRGVRFTNEGMTLRQGKLYLLPEDDPSRLFVFEVQ